MSLPAAVVCATGRSALIRSARIDKSCDQIAPLCRYATTAKVKRLEWFAFTKEYFLNRCAEIASTCKYRYSLSYACLHSLHAPIACTTKLAQVPYRDTLAMVLLLIDASVTVQAADLECASWLADSQVWHLLFAHPLHSGHRPLIVSPSRSACRLQAQVSSFKSYICMSAVTAMWRRCPSVWCSPRWTSARSGVLLPPRTLLPFRSVCPPGCLLCYMAGQACSMCACH